MASMMAHRGRTSRLKGWRNCGGLKRNKTSPIKRFLFFKLPFLETNCSGSSYISDITRDCIKPTNVFRGIIHKTVYFKKSSSNKMGGFEIDNS